MKNRKKILFVEYFSFLGGGQVVLLNLLKYLRNDYEIYFLLFNRGQIEEKLKDLKINYFFIKAPEKVKYRYFWKMMPVLIKVYKFIKELKPDIIYANCYFAVKLLAPVLKILKIKAIWHKHIIIEKSYNSYLAREIRKYSKFVEKIICVSKAVKESLIKIGVSENKLVVIYNGIELIKNKRVLREKIRKKYNLNGKFVIGSIGYFRENKRFDIFISVANILKKFDKNFRFVLSGKSEKDDNFLEKKLENMVKNFKLNDIFIFTGYIERYKILPAFDFFVLPSQAEPFGLVTLEALSLGIPVIAFATGGTKEIIKDNKTGFLVTKIAPEYMASKILKIYKNKKLLNKIKINSKKLIENKFDLKIQIKRIRYLIENIIK